MPFQDIEDTEATPIPRIPTPAERWLRKVFLEDWGLKLLALAITVVLWLAVTGQNKPMTMRVSGVQLNFLRPDGFEISNEPPGTVDVILTGSRDKLDRIGPRDLVATVDLSDQKPGERILKLTLDRVKMDLQEDVKIQGFHPGSVPIRLEPIIDAPVDVEVKFEGKLPEGFEVAGVSASPAKVRVRGPADRVNALRKVVTETVSLDGRKEDFNLSRVEINIPDPKIELLDPTVDIHVDIAERKRGDLHLRFADADRAPYLAGLIKLAPRL
ncbi:MAG TPA: CdaR family protein [Pyrinomonadaceae bacterium]|jgi:YbbR domain-containing protein|nr:CdaR family protein [Pyrinomonadaceae bacterium]